MNEALALLVSGDAETWGTIGRSLRFSLFSTLFSLLPGIALGIWMAGRESGPRRAAVAVVGALTAVPTVVVGLVVYMLISRNGPLGGLGWLFAGPGIVIGQTLLALPIVASLVWSGLARLDPRFHETLATFGVRGARRLGAILREGAPVMAGALVAAFGRVTGEVGVAMLLGGNIRFVTRTMTTAIALDASMGDFGRALAFGLVLLFIALVVNFTVHIMRPHER